MSDTLIFARLHELPTVRDEPPAPAALTSAPAAPRRSFKSVLDGTENVEVVEAVAAHQSSLLELINALLADDNVKPERRQLLALRAKLRRYSSEVNVLASLLSQLSRR